MNRTTKVVVALIVAAGLSTTVYAIPEQRVLAHSRLHLLNPDSDPDDFPFGPNSPDPPTSAPPPSDPPGPHFGPNCVGCISTQNLANGAVTNPKLATGSVLSANIGAGAVATPNIADRAITTPKIAPGAVFISTLFATSPITKVAPGFEAQVIAPCPSGTVLTGGGYANLGKGAFKVTTSNPSLIHNGWFVDVINTDTQNATIIARAVCATIHP